ncbi:MAG: hypothetical protein P1U56_05615 [Saprospiraceae bacterium]|nr:hypothetical protein [Saprospiraceae bacterium]
MCAPTQTFIFCTCKEHGKISNTILPNYNWTLHRFKGWKETILTGKVILPTQDLENKVTVENVLHQLNSEKLFDFEYLAQEKDCLTVQLDDGNSTVSYFKLKYINGSWKEGGNNPFKSNLEELASGKIKIISPKA